MSLPRIQPIERATNRMWDEWMTLLDGIGARDFTHHEIATKALENLDGEIDNPAWWAQSIAVTYEQAIGRRIPGQRSDGTFQMSVSKSTALGMEDLMERWTAFAANDQAVLDLIAGEVRVSGTENRITWRTRANDGSSIIVIGEPKKDGRASIIAQQMGLETIERNDAARSMWRDTLTRFLKDGLK